MFVLSIMLVLGEQRPASNQENEQVKTPTADLVPLQALILYIFIFLNLIKNSKLKHLNVSTKHFYVSNRF